MQPIKGNQGMEYSRFRSGTAAAGLILVLASCFAMASTAQANAPTAPQILNVRVGLGDCYKAGLWTQVDVLLRGGDTAGTYDVTLVTPDSDGVPGAISKPFRLPAGQETTVRMITRFGHVQSQLTVELREADKLVTQKTFTTTGKGEGNRFPSAITSQRLILNLGATKAGLGTFGYRINGAANSHPIEAPISDVAQLPTDWVAYEAVDSVALATNHAQFAQQLAADPARLKALDHWLRMGGRLLISAGPETASLFGPNSALSGLLPGRFDRLVNLRQTGGLELYTGSRAALLHDRETSEFRVPRIIDVRGIIEASEADLPLVVRAAHGFGQIVFLAGDIDASPLGQWSERAALLARLLDLPGSAADESSEGGAMMHLGFDDMTGQLRSALDNFNGVEIAPFWLIAGLVIVYVLLLGPGDYFLVRKLFRRMEWTWLTFPLLVVITSVVAWLLADHLKGNQFRRNQLDLVDVDVASSTVRGTTWLNVFSPRMESYDFAIAPRQVNGQPATGPVWMAWLGLPGSALGGMDARSTGSTLWTDRFQYAENLSALFGVPVQIWSTKSLTGRWQTEAPVVPAAELTEADQFVTGSITNTLPFALEDCLVAFGHSVYDIGTLAPGEVARLGPGAKRSELRTLLTGRKAVFSEGAKHFQEATPYDQTSTDPWYVARIMMFYDAAGGRRYTGLANGYQHFVDWSSLLKTDRAVLIGRGPKRTGETHQGATLLRDGQPIGDPNDQHQTIYRFLIPVITSRTTLGGVPTTTADIAAIAPRSIPSPTLSPLPANEHD